MLNSVLQSIGENAAKRAIPELTHEVRESAQTSGWPNNVVAALSVKYNDGDMAVSYPSQLTAEVEDLEYGTSSTPPRSVIRRFNLRLESYMQNAIQAAMSGSMDEVVGAL